MCVEFKKRRDYIYEREEAIPGISALKPEGAFYLFVDVSGLYGKAYEGQENRIGSGFCIHLLEKICGCCALCRFRQCGLLSAFPMQRA